MIGIAIERPNSAWSLIDHYRNLRTGDCYLAQVDATEAAILRRRRQLGKAEAALGRARRRAKRCPFTQADMTRRLGQLRMTQGRYEESCELFGKATRFYRAKGDCGHDFFGDGLAHSIYCHAQTLAHMGDYAAAVANWRLCLQMWSPVDQQDVYAYTNINLAWALHKGGLWVPIKELDDARKRFMGTKKATIPRASLYWLAGQVCYATGGTRKRSEWRGFLLRARDDFISMKLYYDAALVVSHLSLTYLKDRTGLGVLIGRSTERMENACGDTKELLKRIHDLASKRTRNLKIDIELADAVDDLRQFAQIRAKNVMPSLLKTVI